MEQYVIRMNGLYGDDSMFAYYRADGDCFNFCHTLENATKFDTHEAVEKIMQNQDFFCKQFNAKGLEVLIYVVYYDVIDSENEIISDCLMTDKDEAIAYCNEHNGYQVDEIKSLNDEIISLIGVYTREA